MPPRMLRPHGLFAILALNALSLTLELSACRSANSPNDVTEASIVVVDSACSFLQGITDNGSVLTVCATLEEIAFIVSVIAPLLLAEPLADEVCRPVPRTNVCATPVQMGVGIQALLNRRRMTLLLDAAVVQ